MTRKALILTKTRLAETHYYILALHEARTVLKPPVTMQNFWKKTNPDTENASEKIEEIITWALNQTTKDDYIVIESANDAFINRICSACKEKGRIPVYPTWDPNRLYTFGDNEAL